MLPVLLAALLALPTGPAPRLDRARAAAADTVAADTLAADTTGLRVGFMVDPLAFYSSTAGFGVGGGVTLRHGAHPGVALRLRAETAQRRGRYRASLFTADPERARGYALASVYFETTGRQYFYGLGPGAGADDRVHVAKDAFEVEARAGRRFGPLLVQPAVRMLVHTVEAADTDDARAGLDDRSRAHLLYLRDVHARQRGVEPGLGLVFTHGAPERSGVVVQGSARRFYGLDDAPGADARLGFDTYTAAAFAFVPLRRGHTLALRTVVQTTRRRSDVPVPFYLLPEFDARLLPGVPRHRFFGNDLVAAAVEYRAPVIRLLDFARVDAAVSVGVGGVYDDLGRQFALDVTFDGDLPDGRDTYPLRPAAGLALRLLSADGTRPRFTAVLGISPENWSLVSFHFIPRLTRDRPIVR